MGIKNRRLNFWELTKQSSSIVQMYFFLETMKPKQRQAESLKEMQEALGPRIRLMSLRLQSSQSKPSGTLMTFEGSPSWTMIRWYGWKNGLHISKKSRFRIVGITMSSSSFSTGVGETLLPAIWKQTPRYRTERRERDRDKQREKRDEMCEGRGGHVLVFEDQPM